VDQHQAKAKAMRAALRVATYHEVRLIPFTSTEEIKRIRQ
jgi:hypothetical protein